MRLTLLSGLVGSAIGLNLLAPAASAQPGRLFHRDSQKACSLFDRNLCKKPVGPTICGQACLGYFPTQWSQWEHVCPGGVGCGAPVPVLDGVTVPPAEVAPMPSAKPADVIPSKPATPPASPKSNTNATPRTLSPSPYRVPVSPVRSQAIQPVGLTPGLSGTQFAK